MKHAIGAAGIALAIAFAAPVAAKDKKYPDNPETIMCPPSRGDLDYAFYQAMDAAKFEEYPSGGIHSWRRKVDGPFHLLSLENARWLHVEFKRFRTAEGTRIVAELRWQTSSYEFGVKQQEVYDIIQQLLDGLQGFYPCE